MIRKSKLKWLLKPFLTCAIIAIALSSCDSDVTNSEGEGENSISNVKTINAVEAQKFFAKTLSVAAAKSSALRTFLKNEAEKQYDKDYDVFYPYVKDKVVENGKTLRDILVSNSSEKEISTIEKSVPLLTIMIPDLSAFSAFSVHNWNTSENQVATTFVDGNDNSLFFAEGDSLLSLPKGDLPNFPFLVVKSNERMKVVGEAASTRADEIYLQYDFADPAFDGTNVQSTRTSYYDEKNPEVAPEDKPYLKKDELDPRCIEAYNFEKENKYFVDREYIYYNLSPKNPSGGRLEPNVREKFYMFRVSPSKYDDITDKQIGEDPYLKDNVFYKKGHPAFEQIAKDLWTDGAFEIEFQSYKGSNSFVETKTISLKGSDLFYIDKFHVRHKHSTGFRHSKWWYSTTPDDLQGKWVDLSSKDLYLTDTWDLSNSPVSIFIKILEKDKGTLKTVSESYTTSYLNKADFGVNIGVTDNLKLNLGFSNQSTSQKTYTISYQYKDENDNLGSIVMNFRDPVIVSNKDASTKGYQMYSLNTGGIDIVIAPKCLR